MRVFKVVSYDDNGNKKESCIDVLGIIEEAFNRTYTKTEGGNNSKERYRYIQWLSDKQSVNDLMKRAIERATE